VTEHLKQALAAEARALGFATLGVAAPESVAGAAARFAEFIAAGMHGEMGWLAAHPERRADPRAMWPEVRSVILLGMNYAPDADPLAMLRRRDRGAISVYAQGDDYHDVIKPRLKQLARWLIATAGGDVKVFVDTAAVLEKPLAQAAGLGWQGKHTNLVSREFGSWLFLGAIFTTLDLPPDATDADHCGQCSACLQACPTAAIVAPYRVDARRCISYLTIEHDGPIPEAFRPLLGNRIYGCDDCQLACPWNRFATPGDPEFAPRAGLAGARLGELFAWTAEEFAERLAGNPIRRIGHERWLRNIAVALGNAPTTPEIIAALRTRANDASPLVREHVVWALERHVGCPPSSEGEADR